LPFPDFFFSPAPARLAIYAWFIGAPWLNSLKPYSAPAITPAVKTYHNQDFWLLPSFQAFSRLRNTSLGFWTQDPKV